MRRRTFLGLAASSTGGLAGCSAGPAPAQTPGVTTPVGGCPAVSGADRTVCPTTEDGPVSVGRTTDTVSGTVWSLGISVTNRTESPLRMNPAGWSILGWDEGWQPVLLGDPVGWGIELVPGDRYGWRLSPTGDDRPPADRHVFLAPDPGTFAFAVPVRGSEPLAAVATFTVTA